MLSDVDVIEVKFVVRLCAKDSELLHLFECMDKANLKYKIDFQMVMTEKEDTINNKTPGGPRSTYIISIPCTTHLTRPAPAQHS